MAARLLALAGHAEHEDDAPDDLLFIIMIVMYSAMTGSENHLSIAEREQNSIKNSPASTL